MTYNHSHFLYFAMKRFFYLFAILFFSSSSVLLGQKDARYAIYVGKGLTQGTGGANTLGFAYKLKSNHSVWLRANLWFAENGSSILEENTRTSINDSTSRVQNITHTAVKQRLNFGIQEMRTGNNLSKFYWIYGLDVGINRYLLTPKVSSTDRITTTITQNGFTFPSINFGETITETKPPVERYLMTLSPHISIGVHLNSHFSLRAELTTTISYFKKDGSMRRFNEDTTLYPLIVQYAF